MTIGIQQSRGNSAYILTCKAVNTGEKSIFTIVIHDDRLYANWRVQEQSMNITS